MQPIQTRLNSLQSSTTKRKFINKMKKAGLNYLLVYNSGIWWRNDHLKFYMACNDVEYLDKIAMSCFGNPLQDVNFSYVEKIN